MNRIHIESALRILIHARNCADISQRISIRAIIRADIQRIRSI
jgi:hypothetical protein